MIATPLVIAAAPALRQWYVETTVRNGSGHSRPGHFGVHYPDRLDIPGSSSWVH
jgi:hypothetical protein